jgi:hypothetical protein
VFSTSRYFIPYKLDAESNKIVSFNIHFHQVREGKVLVGPPVKSGEALGGRCWKR